MSTTYRRHHPRWHRERTPIFWWLGRFAYTRFIARELTSLAVAWVALLVVVEVAALGRGPAAWERLHALLRTPPAVVLHALVLGVLLFHSLTWLHLAPKAVVVRLGGRRLPDGAVLAGHYAAWAAASLGLLWVLS